MFFKLAIRKDAIRKKIERPWNKNYEFYKSNFIETLEIENYNKLYSKYNGMDRQYIIVSKFLIFQGTIHNKITSYSTYN